MRHDYSRAALPAQRIWHEGRYAGASWPYRGTNSPVRRMGRAARERTSLGLEGHDGKRIHDAQELSGAQILLPHTVVERTVFSRLEL